MKKLVLAAATMLASVSILAQPAVGTWTTVTDTPMGAMEAEMGLNADGTGYMEGMMGRTDFEGVTYEGNSFSVSFTADSPMGPMDMTMTGTVDGDNMTGESENMMGVSAMTGTRN